MNEVQIIIPAYNAHNTLEKTLESIAIQRTNFQFEVCIVDDNSKDNYNDLIEYFKTFLNIECIKTSKNIGPGLARQYGIDNTTSKYLIFIDADDYFYSPYSLKIMYDFVTKNNADLGGSSFIYERDNERKIVANNLTWLHGKIYKRSFLIENNIKFNETRANEDNGFNHLICLLNAKIEFTNEITYVYQENSNSITRKDDRLYRFTGLEWFAYNINWSIEESKRHFKNEIGILKLSLGSLVSLYIYYLELRDKYDTSKILKWSKQLKKHYDEFKDEPILPILKQLQIENKKIQNKDKNINYFITFDEFLTRIEEYHD